MADGSKNEESLSPTNPNQKQLTDMIGGVERNLAVACETIVHKMKELEQRVAEMEESIEKLAGETETKHS